MHDHSLDSLMDSDEDAEDEGDLGLCGVHWTPYVEDPGDPMPFCPACKAENPNTPAK